MSMDANAKIISVIGGCRRSGRWLVPGKTRLIALFGRAIVDLRDAQTAAEELEFSCISIFANITFIVPDGAEVRPSGIAILGSSRSTVPLSDAVCNLPAISVEAITLFGRLRIRTAEEAIIESKATEAVVVAEVQAVRAPAPTQTPVAPEPAATASPETGLQETPRPETVQSGPRHSPADNAEAANLSAPIEPFRPDDTSPIHEVTPPDDISALGEAQREAAEPAHAVQEASVVTD